MLLPTFMALRLDSAATTQWFAIFLLTFNMLVNKHSDFSALGFLNGVDVIGTCAMSSVTYSGFDTI